MCQCNEPRKMCGISNCNNPCGKSGLCSRHMNMSATQFFEEQEQAGMKILRADEVRVCCEPNCSHAALGFSPYCAYHRDLKKITCRAPNCSNLSIKGSNCCAIHDGREDVTITCANPNCKDSPIAGSKYCQRHFLQDKCPSFVRAKKNIEARKPVNPFIVLETYLNTPCTIRVDLVIAIVVNKVHIDNKTVITLAEGEVAKLHRRIEQYYGGSINGYS